MSRRPLAGEPRCRPGRHIGLDYRGRCSQCGEPIGPRRDMRKLGEWALVVFLVVMIGLAFGLLATWWIR